MDNLKIRFRVVPEFDVRPLEALLAHLRAFAPPIEPEPVSQPVRLEKARKPKRRAKRALRETTAPAKRPRRPFVVRKGAKTAFRPEVPSARVPGTGGRVTRCRTCDKPFRVTNPGPLPKDCPICKAKPKTTSVEARAFSEDEPIGKKTA